MADHPRTGIGHPEALKGGNDITYSRHITAHDRIIYDIYDETLVVLVIETDIITTSSIIAVIRLKDNLTRYMHASRESDIIRKFAGIMKQIEVVAAIIRKGDKIFATQRG